MRIGWVGFHSEGIPGFSWLLATGTKPVVFVTLREEEAEKRSAQARAEYLRLCAAHAVPVHETSHINAPETVALLRNAELDILIVLGWSQILDAAVLNAARFGAIGAHASLLPHNRGSAPVNWAIINGEVETGNTFIWLAENVDDGDIVDQVSFPISLYDTCATIYDKVAQSNREMLERLLAHLSQGEIPRRPQPHTGEPLLPRRRPKDGLISWGATAREVYDFVRALTIPYPGAFTYLDGIKYLVWKAALLPDLNPGRRPGSILGPAVSPDPSACGLAVACGTGAVLLLAIEDETGCAVTGRALCEMNWNGKEFSNE